MVTTRQIQTSFKGADGPPGGSTILVEAEMWGMADTPQGSMDAAEYKHVILGLIFLKYVSDTFKKDQSKLDTIQNIDPKDPDECRAQNSSWVPPEGRLSNIKAQAHQPTIGQIVDSTMAAIERENPVIKDVLGRVYECFLSRFTNAEGKKGGEFYTPRSVVKMLVEMLQPYNGRVYDPCCGSAGMFVQSVEFIRAYANGNGNGVWPKRTYPYMAKSQTTPPGSWPR